MKLRFTGPVRDYSGYGYHSRLLLSGLFNADFDIQVVSDGRSSDLLEGKEQALISDLEQVKLIPDIRIWMNPPRPEIYQRREFPRNDGIRLWAFPNEADRIPKSWVEFLNANMDGILTFSNWGKSCLDSSGLEIPVWVIPTSVDPSQYMEVPREKILIQGVDEKDFVFYSIFQWNERKNPDALFQAYWSEFSGEKDVVLVVLSYHSSGNSDTDKFILRHNVQQLIRNFPLEGPHPRTVLLDSVKSRKTVDSLHSRGDCFVLPHRGEGYGLPLVEATCRGKSSISTGFGAFPELVEPVNLNFLDYQLRPVFNSEPGSYCGNMLWAEPNVVGLKKNMREVFSNREYHQKQALEARKVLMDRFSPPSVQAEYRRLFSEIYSTLRK